jgi:hypothetical protein
MLFLVLGCGSSSGTNGGPDAGADVAAQDDAAQADAPPPQDDAAPQQDAPAPSGVGDPCTAIGMGQGTCNNGLFCITPDMSQGQLPGGYCSAQCSRASDCPWDAACVIVGDTYQLCMQRCAVDGDCRVIDGYRCVLDDRSGAKICMTWAPPPGTIDGGACVTTDAGPHLGDPRLFGTSQQLAQPATSAMEAETSLVAAATDGGVYVAAAYISVEASGYSKMAVNTSSNAGQDFGPAVIVDDTVTATKSDPVLAYSLDGKYLFLTWIGYNYAAGGTTTNMHSFVARSDDHGATWATAVNVSGADAVAKSLDKPWIATGPGGVVYATYMASQNYDSTIRVARSLDNGGTWEAPVTVAGASNTAFVNLAYPTTDADGNLYVGWITMRGDQNGSSSNDVSMARWDVGTPWGTFTAPVKANTDTDEVVFNDVGLVAAPVAGHTDVYAVYTAGSPAGVRWNVRLAHSSDKGATFAPAITVNDDPTCAAHFLPSIAIDAKERVHVTWYDNRFGTSAGALYYAAYDPATQLVGPNQLVSDEWFEFTIERSAQNWLGDYTGLYTAGGHVFASWSDPRGVDQTSHVRVARGVLP